MVTDVVFRPFSTWPDDHKEIVELEPGCEKCATESHRVHHGGTVRIVCQPLSKGDVAGAICDGPFFRVAECLNRVLCVHQLEID